MTQKVFEQKILVRVDGSKQIGLGHVYNMLTILQHFKNSKIIIVMDKKKKLGYNKFRKRGYTVKFFSNFSELLSIIKKFQPNFIFNDILNTKQSYMQKLKQFDCKIINFEDRGEGCKIADKVFNPIYFDKNSSKEFFGPKYACVRDEFRIHHSGYIRKNVKKVAITFGGTDPTNKTFQVLKTFQRLSAYQIKLNVILGLGYSKRNEIKSLVNEMTLEGYTIQIIEKSDNISSFISDCDFVITSNGRTVFEIAAMKIPMIAIAVNNRERLHSFVDRTKSGYQINTTSKNIQIPLIQYIQKMMIQGNRQRFNKNLKKNDLLKGLPLVIDMINKTN